SLSAPRHTGRETGRLGSTPSGWLVTMPRQWVRMYISLMLNVVIFSSACSGTTWPDGPRAERRCPTQAADGTPLPAGSVARLRKYRRVLFCVIRVNGRNAWIKSENSSRYIWLYRVPRWGDVGTDWKSGTSLSMDTVSSSCVGSDPVSGSMAVRCSLLREAVFVADMVVLLVVLVDHKHSGRTWLRLSNARAGWVVPRVRR